MSPCQSCHAGCCRSFAVPVTGADILRIERERGLDFWQFVCRWADPDGEISRNYAPQFRFDDFPQTPYVICLSHHESQNHPGTTKCLFLEETAANVEQPLGTARCGAYSHRPLACRVFPSRVHSSGDLVVLHDVPSRGRDGDHPVYNLCPRPWTPDDVDPLQIGQDLAVAHYEMRFFKHLALVWNRSPQSWEIFPEFLRIVYQNRVIRDSSEQADVAAANDFVPFAQPNQRKIPHAA